MELNNRQILFKYGLVEGIHYKLIDENKFTYNNVSCTVTKTSAFKIEELSNFIKKFHGGNYIIFIKLYDIISDDFFPFDFCRVEKSLVDVRITKIYNIRKRIFEEKMQPYLINNIKTI